MEKDKEEDNLLERLGIAFLIILVIGSIFEIGLLIYSFANADEVECNLLWCTFTTERSISTSQHYMTSSSECFINGERVNCSKFDGNIYYGPIQKGYNETLFRETGRYKK